MLTTYREVAATALTLKTAALFEKTIDCLTKLNPEAVRAWTFNNVKDHKKLIAQLTSLDSTISQLKLAQDVQGAGNAHASLSQKKKDLCSWLESQLCPNFDKVLNDVQSWDKEHLQVDMTANCKSAAADFPEQLPPVPEGLDTCFLLRCFLAVSKAKHWDCRCVRV